MKGEFLYCFLQFRQALERQLLWRLNGVKFTLPTKLIISFPHQSSKTPLLGTAPRSAFSLFRKIYLAVYKRITTAKNHTTIFLRGNKESQQLLYQ